MSIDDDLLETPFMFRPRSTPLPCDLRPVWRIAVLLLILEQCRDRRATIEQLHVMNWAVRNPKSQEDFIGYLNETKSPNQVIVRYDPSLTRAIDFALAEKVVSSGEEFQLDSKKKSSSFRIQLTDKGAAIAEELQKDEECFVREKSFLSVIGKKVTQASIQELFDWSRNRWA